MKYSSSVSINRDRNKVVALWQDTNHYSNWQDGFISTTPLIENVDGQRMNRLLYKMGKRDMALIETVLEDNLPDYKVCLYVHDHMSNTLKATFETNEAGYTVLTYEIEYLEFNHFIPRLMAKFFPGIFRKQSEKWMKQFKMLAER